MLQAINSLIFLRFVNSFTWRDFVSFLIFQWKKHEFILGEAVKPSSLFTLKVIDNHYHLIFYHNPTSLKFRIPFRDLEKIREECSLEDYKNLLIKCQF